MIGNVLDGSFTQEARLEFLEYITTHIGLDVGNPVAVVYLDFQEVFDKVPHARLICKLKAHGISDKILT